MKNKFLVCLMAAFLLGLSLFSWLKPVDEFSDSERRFLKEFPELNMETVVKGKFMSEFESYTLDQFPMRDMFRGIKSALASGLFRQKDNNDLYQAEGHIVSMEYPENEGTLDWAASRFENIYNMYLKESQCNAYFSIIPDKNYFLGDVSGHLTIDYDAFIDEMVQKVPFMTYIDILDTLTIESYYKTDSHWKQTELLDTAKKLAEEMGSSLEAEYETVTLDKPFYGVYYGQLALPGKGDVLAYLSNEMLEQCIVYDYQNEKEMPVYDLEKLDGKDPYEMFLGGPLSLITIENPNAKTGKELVVFRDSFGSSIVPLLVEGYEKITLVDIRYIQGALLEKYISFENQDVLFIYSTSVLNNSNTIK